MKEKKLRDFKRKKVKMRAFESKREHKRYPKREKKKHILRLKQIKREI